MTAAASRAGRPPWTSPHSQQRRQHPKSASTTPRGLPPQTPASVGQPSAPLRTPHAANPAAAGTSSPNYFGLVHEVEADSNPVDSNAGGYARKNWKTPAPAKSRAGASPPFVPHDANPDFEEFRRQSTSSAFQLDHGNFSRTTTGDSSQRSPMDVGSEDRRPVPAVIQKSYDRETSSEADPNAMDVDDGATPAATRAGSKGSFWGLPRIESPANMGSQGPTQGPPSHTLSIEEERNARLSLPSNRRGSHAPGREAIDPGRANTLPSTFTPETPNMLLASEFASLVERAGWDKILLLDLRVSPQFAASHLREALNLCIPTTLLKRPSFNIQKLLDTFPVKDDKDKFSRWRQADYIVMYDANSAQLKDATSAANTIKKFVNEGWRGMAFVLRGGFQAASRTLPQLVERPAPPPKVEQAKDTGASPKDGKRPLTIDARAAGAMQVAGGCPMPANPQGAANPFFGNIRQNMDLLGGVGQLPVQRPAALSDRIFGMLPPWLRSAADEKDQGKAVANTFLRIEKAEQARMQTALSASVAYPTGSAKPAADAQKNTPGAKPPATAGGAVQVAGIEKGSKNRYRDILPFDHSRVRLQNVPSGGCDYINASYIRTPWSHRQYIATQAPVPTTFEDFWRVVWEQDARVIVMLTAETEGPQRKCHPYWLPESYGQMELKALSEKKVALSHSRSAYTPLGPNLQPPLHTSPLERPAPARRRATNPHGTRPGDGSADHTSPAPPMPSSSSPGGDGPSHVTVRKLALAHAQHPFAPLREITQIQYTHWPDFGAPAHPRDLLALVEQTRAASRGAAAPGTPAEATADRRPVVVHCSAGCGRTGTFCTVDTVVDQLQRQRAAAATARRGSLEEEDGMDVDGEEREDESAPKDGDAKSLDSGEVDLVAKAVADFRGQRLSMVQTLRQFVLCYETVLEWAAREVGERVRKENARRSYQG